MSNVLGFMGLLLSLTSMTMKDILYLRILSLSANAVYIAYGFLIGAVPIVTGSFIAVAIHAFNIYRLKRGARS